MHQTSSFPQRFSHSRIRPLPSLQRPQLPAYLVQTFLQHLQAATGAHAFSRHSFPSCLEPRKPGGIVAVPRGSPTGTPKVSHEMQARASPRGGGTAHARATPGMARPTVCFLPAGNAVCSRRSGSGRENFQKRGTNWRSSAYPPTSEPMAHESRRSLFSSGRAYSVCPPNRPPSSLCVPRSTTSTVWSEQHRDSWLWSPGFTTALALPFCGTLRGLHEDRQKLSQVCRRWPPLCGGRLTRRDRSAHDALGCTCGTRCSSEGGGVAGGR